MKRQRVEADQKAYREQMEIITEEIEKLQTRKREIETTDPLVVDESLRKIKVLGEYKEQISREIGNLKNVIVGKNAEILEKEKRKITLKEALF